MYAARSMFVAEDITFVDGNTAVDTPADAFDEPQRFAFRMAASARQHKCHEMTVILDRCAAKRLGLPAKPPQAEKTRKDHKLLQAWRSDGWHVSELSPWFTLWAPGRPSIHFGVEPWLPEHELHHEDPCNLTHRLARFQALTGVAFHGNSGLAATAALRDYWKGDEPMWRPGWDKTPPALSDCEKAYIWTRPGDGLAWCHGFDANRQYLAAAWNTSATMGPLRHKGSVEFNKRIPGYWLITVPVWNETRLPHPANYVPGARAWVATPTMELLHELADKGLTVAPQVHDSYLADRAGTELFRRWVSQIEDAYQASLSDGSDDGEAVTGAIKGMYKFGVGMMHRRSSRVHRPDWHHSIISKARANLFRKLLAVGMYQNRWPVEVDYDKVWYESKSEDYTRYPVLKTDRNGRAAPAFPMVDKLGGFKPGGTRKGSAK